MIEKELLFNYNLNYKYLFDITTNNNVEILKIIDELNDYKQGVWKGNKRKDLIDFKINDIPELFKSFTSGLISDNVIPLKIKIKLLKNDDESIIIKIKANLVNRIANLIFKLINLKIFATIEKINDNSSNVKIKYIIKSILPSSIMEMIDKYIEQKLNNNFIRKFDNYLKNLKH
jgi:hypothetical protein